MKVGPLISIQQTPAMLGLNITPGETRVNQAPARMQLQQPAAELSIRPAQTKIEIDHSQVRNDIGIGSVLDLMKDAAKEGLSTAQAEAAEIARQGDMMMNQPSIIPEIVEQESFEEIDYNIALIPRHRPEVRFDGRAEPTIEVIPREPVMHVQTQKPLIEVKPDAIKAYLKQKHAIQIDYIGPRELWA